MQRKWYRMLLEKDIDAVNGMRTAPLYLRDELTIRCFGQERGKDEVAQYCHAVAKVLQSPLS